MPKPRRTEERPDAPGVASAAQPSGELHEALQRQEPGEMTAMNGHHEGATNRAADQDDLNQRIAVRAYEKFVARGCEHGHDQDDWLEAERECRESVRP